MTIWPARTRSLLVGIGVLLETAVGAYIMFRTLTAPYQAFLIVWILIGVVAAGVSFYNAFGERHLHMPGVDVGREEEEQLEGALCTQCETRAGIDDLFCRHCGSRLPKKR